MNLALWIGAGLLAGVALAGGISKTFVPKQRLAAVHGGGWTAGVSAGFVKTLGVLEFGEPGAIFRAPDGKVLHTLALDVLDGRIQTIRLVINPDKLWHVGPVADAWAIARALKQARRDGPGS